MIEWFFATLRQYPEIAIFLALALGYYFGGFTFRGIGLGSVTATLLAAVVIGQIGITVSPPLKATVFLMFLFAVGYEVGPQFVRGVAKDGMPQALYSVVLCLFCLAAPVVIAKYIGKYVFRFHDAILLGAVSGARTTTASLGLVCDAAKSQVPALGYTVTYAVGNTLLTIWGMVLIILLS